MFDSEGGGRSAGRDLEQAIVAMVVNKLLEHSLIASTRKIALVIKQVEQAVRSALNQSETVYIIYEVNVAPGDRLPLILLLFIFEDVLIEVELQVFVGVVYAELLEVVLVAKVFEAKNVQDTDIIAWNKQELIRKLSRRGFKTYKQDNIIISNIRLFIL